jgi:hypothetical protein
MQKLRSVTTASVAEESVKSLATVRAIENAAVRSHSKQIDGNRYHSRAHTPPWLLQVAIPDKLACGTASQSKRLA